MKFLDVNVLVYAHREDAPQHRQYRGWLENLLSGPEPFAVADLVLSGFLRLVTHPRVFDPPTIGVRLRQAERTAQASPESMGGTPGGETVTYTA